MEASVLCFLEPGYDNQAAQYFASCYPENTLLRVEFEVGLEHIGKGFQQVRDVRLFLLAYNYDVVKIG
jgi:hypothetical protein